jgi:hypothetical protein
MRLEQNNRLDQTIRRLLADWAMRISMAAIHSGGRVACKQVKLLNTLKLPIRWLFLQCHGPITSGFSPLVKKALHSIQNSRKPSYGWLRLFARTEFEINQLLPQRPQKQAGLRRSLL